MTSHLQLQTRLEDTLNPPNIHGELVWRRMTASLSDSRINIYGHKELFSKASATAARALPASGDNPPLHQHFVFPQHSVDNGKNLNLLHFISMTQVTWRILSSKKVTCFSKESRIIIVKSSEIENYIYNKF